MAPTGAPDQLAWAERQRVLGEVGAWDLTGRVAVKLNGDGWNAHLRWRQQGESYSIRVFDPFGRTLALVEGDAELAVLRTAEGESFEAADAETLMDEQLGWSLPLAGMRYWLRGLPRSGSSIDFLRLDEIGRPELLQQAGWSITYADYGSARLAALPMRVNLEQKFVTVRLAVVNWGTPTP